MSTDKRVRNRIPLHFAREDTSVKLDSGPYIGKIKNNLDSTRSGRLQVYIPDLSSGEEEDPQNWRTVAYASPFFGSTYQPDKNKLNKFDQVKHTYGFWAVPPDLDNFVLCTFIAGDPNRGFWFACIPNQLGHWMVPGIAGSDRVETRYTDQELKDNLNPTTVVAEFNENKENINWSGFTEELKPVHEPQAKILANQGLEDDFVRGVISSSSQRESPSTVFGWSTPGRPVDDPANDPKYEEKLRTGVFEFKDLAVNARRGGHTFVMDDGNYKDKDRLVRLRSSSGHQILMHDSEKIMYISNSEGTVWIELTAAGHLNIYSTTGVNVRTQGTMNYHADENINFFAGNNIKFKSKSFNIEANNADIVALEKLTHYGGTVKIGSDGTLSLSAEGTGSFRSSSNLKFNGAVIDLNGVSGEIVSRPDRLKTRLLPETGRRDGKWVSQNSTLNTVVTIAPTHEPWAAHQNTRFGGITGTEFGLKTGLTRSLSGGSRVPPAQQREEREIDNIINEIVRDRPPDKDLPVINCENQEFGPEDRGPTQALSGPVKKPLPRNAVLARQDIDPFAEQVGPLTPDQVRALCLQIAYSESNFNYKAVNPYNYLGKYQFGAAALVDLGYVKKDAYSKYGNKATNFPNSWTGRDGINSKEDFLNSKEVQERVMIRYIKLNLATLQRIGAIKSNDSICTIAGMLAATHLIGAGGAKNWRLSASGQDANGTTATSYFNMGRYAVDVLAVAASQRPDTAGIPA